MIIAINYVLRIFIIKLIIYIGKDTESEQTRLICNGVFIVQFFNTALLLLLVNANFSENFGPLGKIFNGSLPDFNSLWFNDIGNTLAGAMFFNIYWPAMEFCGWFGFRTFFRLLDRNFGCDVHRTKKTTIQTYYEIYSGPTFFIHYKYSSILNITFVTMMYGLGLPVLFPIAAFSLFGLYCVEKLMLYYSYRMPPMYDEKLNRNALILISYAPLLFLSFGYWMFSSHQLYANEVYYRENSSIPSITDHIWYSVFTKAGYQHLPSIPLLIFFWIFLLGTIFRSYLDRLLLKIFGFRIFEIDEDLDNYFNTIDDNDRHWSISEENNVREQFKAKILPDETLEKFKTTKIKEGSHMKGVHCYDILANPLYLDDFQYFSPALPDRETYIVDDDDEEGNDNAQSDLVKIILNLAFLTEKQAKEFSFSKDSYKTHLEGKLGNLVKIN
jgi:hypothetical protein